IAATKTVSVEAIRAAQQAGVTICGEKRVQEAAAKIPQDPGMTRHLIGHLQRNKARRAAELFEMIHSLESPRLAVVLDRIGTERGRPIAALIEVNVAEEPSKSGVSPSELSSLVEHVAGRHGLVIHGLMAIPPLVDEPARTRGYFRKLAQLAADLRKRSLPGVSAGHLSMGMSSDYELAVEEGATFVRVGTALFGPRE
ncbi:MAG: YggS family pyridoxal phosphate-dependent enzyme, partial [Acidobacteriota bacterium]